MIKGSAALNGKWIVGIPFFLPVVPIGFSSSIPLCKMQQFKKPNLSFKTGSVYVGLVR